MIDDSFRRNALTTQVRVKLSLLQAREIKLLGPFLPRIVILKWRHLLGYLFTLCELALSLAAKPDNPLFAVIFRLHQAAEFTPYPYWVLILGVISFLLLARPQIPGFWYKLSQGVMSLVAIALGLMLLLEILWFYI